MRLPKTALHRLLLSIVLTVVATTSLTSVVAPSADAASLMPTHYGLKSTVPVGTSPTAIAVHQASQTFYVANYGSGSVSIVRDGIGVATVPVGTAPSGVAVDQSNGTVYVTNTRSNSVSVIQGHAVAATIPVGGEPTSIAVDSSDHTVYVINRFDYSVSVIRGGAVATTLNVGAEPFAIAVEESTHTAYVTNLRGFSVSVIHNDAVTGIPVGSSPAPIAVDAISGTVYVGSVASNTVAVIKAGTVRNTIPVGGGPWSIAINQVDHSVYVGSRDSNEVSVIRGDSVASTIAVGARPSAVAVDQSTGVVYVANTSDKTVSVLQDDSVVATVPTPLALNAAAVAVNSETHSAYVTQYDNAGLAEIAQIPFDVDRIDGEDRYAVATAISHQAFPTTAPVVFIATGTNYPDALSAGPAAVKSGGPVLLTPSDRLPSGVAAEISRLKPGRIWIIGGINSISASTERQLSDAWPRTSVGRIGGADRYEVSRNIAQQFFAGANHAYVATGSNYPDALSAGGAAGHVTSPVVLVNGGSNKVDSDAATLLRDTLGVSKITIAGGPNSVSVGVQTDLQRLAATSRITGADRYEASLGINLDAYQNSARVFLATGQNFPDALAGSAWAGSLGAPLFVVPPTCVPAGVIASLQSLNASRVTLLGGRNSLGDGVQNLSSCP